MEGAGAARPWLTSARSWAGETVSGRGACAALVDQR